MNFESEALLSFYKDIAPLDGHDDVMLTRHVESGRVFVKKTVPAHDRALYEQLRKMELPGIPGIVLIAEAGDTITVIEEYITGTPMDAYMNERGLFSEDEAVAVIESLCDILEPLHSAVPPIIHRDIKPANIIVGRDMQITLVDFNAAKRFDKEKRRDTVLMGTADFAAPEQYGFAQSDARTDIYALGTLLNIMLTGRLPKQSLCEGRLARIVSKCTSLDPANRYQSVSRLRKALRSGFNGFVPPGFRSRHPWKMTAAALTYMLVLYIGCTLEIEGVTSDAVLTVYRLFTLAMLLGLILLPFNYMGIIDRLPLGKSRNPNVRIFARVLWTMIIVAAILTAGAILIVIMDAVPYV